MTVIIKKKYTYLLFILVPYIEFLKLLEFQRGREWSRCLLLFKWGNFWKAPTSPKDGGGLPGRPAKWLQGGKFQPYPVTSGEGRKSGDWVQLPKANDLINCSDFLKPPYKSQEMGFPRASGLKNQIPPRARVMVLKLHRGRSPHVGDLILCISSPGCWFISFHILCNKPVV